MGGGRTGALSEGLPQVPGGTTLCGGEGQGHSQKDYLRSLVELHYTGWGDRGTLRRITSGPWWNYTTLGGGTGALSEGLPQVPSGTTTLGGGGTGALSEGLPQVPGGATLGGGGQGHSQKD